MTVIVSATSRTSCSLWLMKTIEVPPSRSARMTVISSSVSCGVSTAVGSSSTSSFASRLSALRISTRCCTPTGRSADERVGRDVEAVALRDLGDLAAGAAAGEEAEAACLLVAEHDVLGHGEHRDEHEVLVHHADAGGHGVARAAEGDRLVVDEDLALVRLVEPVEDVHQGGLAGAVLAEQGVDLARLDDEVDRVVGRERAEALGDRPAARVSRRSPPSSERDGGGRDDCDRVPPAGATSSACRSARRLARRGDLDRAADDARLDRVELALQRTPAP